MAHFSASTTLVSITKGRAEIQPVFHVLMKLASSNTAANSRSQRRHPFFVYLLSSQLWFSLIYLSPSSCLKTATNNQFPSLSSLTPPPSLPQAHCVSEGCIGNSFTKGKKPQKRLINHQGLYQLRSLPFRGKRPDAAVEWESSFRYLRQQTRRERFLSTNCL